ncbi:uncharacterized protein [Acropora muricata]
MFWTDWGSAPKIEKATLTGSQRVAIVTSNLQWPNGMELDKGNKRIYWVDGGTDRIESVNYQGNNRILLSKVTGFHAFGVAMISPFLFFTDWASGGVLHKLDADTGNHIVSNYNTRGWLMGIVAYDQSTQPPVSNQCNINNGGCSHFCVVTSSSPLCVCPTGFALKQDGRTCENKIKKFFLFTDADDKSTNIISLDVNYFASKRLFSHHGQRPIALDFDPVKDRVYWTDVEQGLILSAFSNGTALKILFRCNVNIPDGIAIDKVGRNIYWSDRGTNRIEVARLDGTKRKLLIKDGLDEPRAIVLDERNGTMYWTDWGSNPKIERAAMDGSSRRSVITGNLGWPNGLTIDRSANLLYWADAKLDKIEVSDLTGANRRLVMSSAADIHPFGLTLYQGMLYWTEWNNQGISRLDLSNGNKKMIITGLKKPMDIHLYDSSVTISGSHPCATNRGLCSDLCLLKPYGGYQCACPTGIFLKPDGKTCDYVMYNNKSSDHFMLFAEANAGEIYKVPLDVTDTPCERLAIRDNISRPVAVDYDPVEGKVYWTDVTLKQIVRSYPNGSHLEVLATHNVINPDGIAIDWIGRNLYWTDAGTNRIDVSRLDGSFRTSLITTNLDLPRAIILDIESRKMYWSDWGYSPKIEKSNMDGTDRRTIVSFRLTWVNSLALDFKSKLLYWCDAWLDLIERVDLQGNNRVVVLNLPFDKYHHPFGLALYQDALFWTDWRTQSVHKYNMTSSASEVFLHGMRRPMGIHMYDYNTITTGNTSCSRLNGGCSHICLPNPTGHRCFCPVGVPLKPGDQFTCQGVNRCPKLYAPAHGSIGPCPNLPGQTCQFSCDQGYVLSGETTRTCNSDGTWTGLQTQCNAVTCMALKVPSNGSRQGCKGTAIEAYNTVCQFSCSPGFNALGSPIRKCLHNSSWSGQDFTCHVISCPSLVTPPNVTKLTPSCASVYGSSCLYSCQTGYTISSGNVTRTCLSTGQWSGNDINCTDSQPPSFGVSCPRSLLLSYAEKGTFSALVNWTNPVATDNSGLTPKVTSNFQSPQTFSVGNHVITYTAEDKSGNKATCTFTVKVIVINCTSLTVTPGGPMRMTNCGNHYGAMCNFSCSIGYRMNGSSTLTCSASGNKPPGFWDNPLPTCQVISCPSLVTPQKATKLTPSCASVYGSSCLYSCQTGYTISSGNVTRTCLSSEQWSGNDINCTDSQPPSFGVSCPRSLLLSYAEKGTFSALVNWTNPVATDNSGLTPKVTSNFQSPQTFSQGNHVITYTAEDKSGNKATCTFTVKVIVINCTSLTVTPGGPMRVTNCGNHYGAMCNFSCSIGYRMNGSSTLTCSASGNQPPGFWDNPLPICQVISCPSLVTPPKATKLTPSCASVYGSSCLYSCQTGYTISSGNVTRTCLSSEQWSGNDINCTDSQPPSFGVSCPRSLLLSYAEKGTFSALVNWTNPVATDNSGLTPKVTSNFQSPQTFSQGNHVITYTAEDKSGNKATCTFTVKVIVINCTSLTVTPGGPMHMTSCGNHYGAMCNFSCSIGYRMNGSSTLTCSASGNKPPGFWDNPLPICQVISCPSLVTPPNATKLTPSCASVYGSSCLYSCQTGYTSSSGKVTRTCLSSGQWSGNAINCTDSEAPSFGVSCPRSLLLSYAEKGTFSALVNWTNPVATDNSGLTPKVTSNFQSPQTFSQGNHVITYTAEDKSGNKATCTFTVKVIVIYCASLMVKAGGPLRMTSCANHYGAICNFSCSIGHRMNGLSIVMCSASGNKPPGFWDNPLPTCQAIRCAALSTPPNGLKTGCSDPSSEKYGTICSFSCKVGYDLTGSSKRQCMENETWSGINTSCQASPCKDLPAPKNGGKACGLVQKEMICTVHCNPGYGFANLPAPIYRCDNSGQWFIVHGRVSLPITPARPDCSKIHIPKKAWIHGQYHYLTNNCNKDPANEIVAKFKILLLRSLWGLHRCRSISDCQKIKVDVDCGEQTRRKRDTAELLPLSVNFALKVPLSNYSSNTSLDLNETSLQISNDILAALEPVASLNITGVVIVVDTTRPPEIQLISFICDDGQVLIGTKCVNCPVGYFFNSSSCQPCAVDEYQDQEARTSCIPCPSRTSTFGKEGSKQRHDCQDLPIPPSDNGHHGMPKIKLISIILGAALVVLLIVLGIWGARKCCRRGPMMDRDLVGFSNDAYDNTVEWEELKIKSSNA